jgi:hypothetical protein
MSRLMHGALVSALLGMGVATPLRAQVDEAALEAEISRLIVERNHAIEDARSAAEARRQARIDRGVRVDSVQVGPFWVLAREEHVEALAEIAREAWSHYEPYVSDSEMRGFRMTLEYNGGRRARSLMEGDGGAFIGRWDPHAAKVMEVGRVIAGQFLATDLGVIGWSDNNFGLHSDQRELLEATYRSLVVGQTRSTVAEGCLRVGGDDCWRALGYLGVEEWWRDWYTPAQLRDRIVQTFDVSRQHKLLFDRCALGQLGECDALIQRRYSSVGTAGAPLGAEARHSLFVYAIHLGGQGSLARLKAAAMRARENATPGFGSLARQVATGIDLLAEAASVPSDELIAGWRDAVLEARPGARKAGLLTTIQSGLWALFLFGFSMRSTRWRH